MTEEKSELTNEKAAELALAKKRRTYIWIGAAIFLLGYIAYQLIKVLVVL